MTNKFEKLKELKQLLDEGLINNEEYSKLKKELLQNETDKRNILEKRKDTAHCPECDSTSIQLTQDVQKVDTQTQTQIEGESSRKINWGRFVAGWALFGVVGGAVGGLTGENKDIKPKTTTVQTTTSSPTQKYCYCLNCGAVWNPKDIIKLKGIISELTGFKIDLFKKNHRIYMKMFKSEMSSYFNTLEFWKSKTMQPTEAQIKKVRAEVRKEVGTDETILRQEERQIDNPEGQTKWIFMIFVFSIIVGILVCSFFELTLILEVIIFVLSAFLSFSLVFLLYAIKNDKGKENLRQEIRDKKEIIKEKENQKYNQIKESLKLKKEKEIEEAENKIKQKALEFDQKHSHLKEQDE